MAAIMMWFLDAMIPTADVWHSQRMSPMCFVIASREATWCPIMFLVLEVTVLIIHCQSSSYFSLSDVPVIFVILLVIGCIVLAAIIGLLCMCLCKSLVAMILFLHVFLIPDTQYQRKRMGMLRNKLQGANRFM